MWRFIINKHTLIIILTLSTTLFSFDFGSIAKEAFDGASKNNKSSKSAKKIYLSSTTVTAGLKEALSIGAKYAVKELGKKDGYLNNTDVKIPLPENVAKAEGIIRSVGGDKIVDDFIKSMNDAATDAAPKTINIFLTAIKSMTIQDAKKILAGDENAATKYFKAKTSDSLREMILPIVQHTMYSNNVTQYYEKANSCYKSSIKNKAEKFGIGSYMPNASEEKLDEYVTKKAIDGLFKMISLKEAQIRKNPVAQTTSLLKKVFGN